MLAFEYALQGGHGDAVLVGRDRPYDARGEIPVRNDGIDGLVKGAQLLPGRLQQAGEVDVFGVDQFVVAQQGRDTVFLSPLTVSNSLA